MFLMQHLLSRPWNMPTAILPSPLLGSVPLRRLLAALFALSQPLLFVCGLSALLELALIDWMPMSQASALPLISILVLVACILLGRSLYLALYDRLTGLPNRTLFLQQLEFALQADEPVAVLLLDIDDFKTINESLGTAAGDRLLLTLARRLQPFTPSTIARVGGNELAVLCNHSQEAAVQLANQLQAAALLPFPLAGQERHITVSIGIAFSDCSAWADDLLKEAQLAVYHAKSLGRARSVVFQPSLRVPPVALRQLETDLRSAIERQELRLHYQALVSLQTGGIAGFEALVRWQHPQHGLLAPAEFIPLAEDNGLIAAVGEWTLIEACQQLRIWQQQFPQEPPLLVSVNLSSKQLNQANLPAQIEQILQQTGIAASTLKLELTESIAIQEEAIAVLKEIKALEVRIGIDDFGTGYSSLSYLYQFPSDTLKIDQSFVRRLGSDSGIDAIVHSIIALAHTLGLTVVAEGIETAGQLAILRRLHCEYGQGYFLSKPLAPDAAAALLATSPRW